MLEKFLEKAREQKASDLHCTLNAKPSIRVYGRLQKLDYPALTQPDLEELVMELLTTEQKQELSAVGEIDLAYVDSKGERYRINVFRQQGSYALALRLLAKQLPTCEELLLPQSICSFTNLKQGLVLITGATGSGKSTTLAALVNRINCERKGHIITLEDPIEYQHTHQQSLVNQREVGNDTRSFASGLRSALREDPDVLMVGELRDKETVTAALMAAETGHLVLTTMHTNDAVATVNRILDMFPECQQQVRGQLADCLQGIASQELLPQKDGKGRVAAFEVLVITSALRALIREGKTHQLTSFIQTGTQYGMYSKETYLKILREQGLIG